MAEVTVSNKNEVVWEDVKRWARNLLVFSAGSIIVFLTALQSGADIQTAAIALYGALINAVIDILMKFKSETRYEDGTREVKSEPISNP